MFRDFSSLLQVYVYVKAFRAYYSDSSVYSSSSSRKVRVFAGNPRLGNVFSIIFQSLSIKMSIIPGLKGLISLSTSDLPLPMYSVNTTQNSLFLAVLFKVPLFLKSRLEILGASLQLLHPQLLHPVACQMMLIFYLHDPLTPCHPCPDSSYLAYIQAVL